jgi:hypothetical protein
MRLQRFPAGVKPLESDLNSLSNSSLEGIGDLISVFSAEGNGSVLFDATAPLVEVDASTNVLTVTAPSQRVAIGGAVETSTDYFESFDVSATDRYVEIFFIISRVPVTATRNFLSLDTDSGSTILQNLEAEIAEITNIRVVFLTQATSPSTVNSLAPQLNSNDLGFARLGSINYDRSQAQTTITLDDNFGFAFPKPPDITIPEIDPVSSTQSGLATPSLLALAQGAVQEVYNDNDTPFLSFAATNTNGVRGFSGSIRYGLGLEVQEGPSGPGLVPDFLPPSAANGQTTKVSRADHVHALSQSGVVRVVKQIQLSSSKFGNLTQLEIGSADLPEGVTLAAIMNVELMWAPSLANPGQVQLGWAYAAGGGTVGARVFVSNVNDLSVEIGTLGALELGSSAARALVSGWTSTSSDTYPSTGFIYVNILALRDGANG